MGRCAVVRGDMECGCSRFPWVLLETSQIRPLEVQHSSIDLVWDLLDSQENSPLFSIRYRQ